LTRISASQAARRKARVLKSMKSNFTGFLILNAESPASSTQAPWVCSSCTRSTRPG